KIAEMMTKLDIDACTLPRLNMLHEGPPLHPAQLDMTDPRHQAFWEDQFRFLRNSPQLYWTMPLNEYLTGMHRCYRFPQELRYALLHPKSIERGVEQSRFYQSIRRQGFHRLHRYRNSIVKRLPWRRKIEWVTAAPPI